MDKDRFIEDLYQRYAEKLFQLGEKLIYGSPYLLDIVEEALQDLFRDAALHYETLCQHEKVDGWLYKGFLFRISKKAQQERKRLGRQISMELSAEYDTLSTNSFDIALFTTLDRQTNVQKIFAMLKPQEAELLRWSYIDNLSAKEIAALRRTSEQVILTQLYRIRNKIKENFKKFEF